MTACAAFDGRRAPVIFGQEHRPGAGKVGVELGPDVRNLRAAPAVDGLVDVAHHEHPRRLRGESANELVLRERRVLKLVHQHVAPPLPVEQPRLLTRAQQRDGGGEQVVEIEGVGRTQVGLVLVVEARELIADIRIALERRSGVAECARHAAAVHADAGVHGGLCGGDAGLCEGRVRLLLVLHEDVHHDLADDGFRVSLVVDYEVVAAAVAVEEVDVLAQHARRDGVERARSDLPRVFLADRRDEPLAHLPRRLVSEGDAEDVRRRHAELVYQVRDAPHEHAGLARARTGEDLHRRDGSDDRGDLLVVHPLEVGRFGAEHRFGRVRGRAEPGGRPALHGAPSRGRAIGEP